MGTLILLGIIALIPIALVVTILLLVTRKSNESFQKKIDTIYTYIVLLASLILVIVGIVSLVISLTDLLLPTDTNITQRDLNGMYSSIMGASGIVVVGIPLFFVHQRRVNKK